MTRTCDNTPITTKRSPLRILAAACIVASGIGFLAFAMSGHEAANHDFISYWAAGHQLLRGLNPYDAQSILSLQVAQGYSKNTALLVRNPPTAFFLILPFGFFASRTGAILWALFLITALMASIRMLWILHGRPNNRLHLLGYCFPSVLACLIIEQIGILLLFGLVMFLYFHGTNPIIAGASLLVCSLKPHLFLPFAAVLLLWVFTSKTYRVLVGFCPALAMSIALSSALDTHCWGQYVQMIRTADIQTEHVPTLSLMIRNAIDPHALWIQLLPTALCMLWAIAYFRKYRATWNWNDQGLLILLVESITAPYAWFTDQAVIVPAILAALYTASEWNKSLLPFVGIATLATIEVMIPLPSHSLWYLWTGPAWLLWYLYAKRSHPMNVYEPPPPLEGAAMPIANA